MPSAALKGGATKPKNHAARQKLAEFIDCFCDRGAFSVEDCRRVFDAGASSALIPRIHAEQLARTGAARLGIEVRRRFRRPSRQAFGRGYSRSGPVRRGRHASAGSEFPSGIEAVSTRAQAY